MEIGRIVEPEVYDPAIDGLRGIAIVLVILFHTAGFLESTFSYFKTNEFFRAGSSGVTLFFILSAFTLTRSSSWRLTYEKTPILNFYIRRAFRILPLWWCFLVVSVILRQFVSGFFYYPTPSQVVANFLMYFGFVANANFTVIGWSLFVEEWFYIFFPLFLPLLLRPFFAVLFTGLAFLFRELWLNFATQIQWPEAGRFPLANYYAFALGILCFHLFRLEKQNIPREKSQKLGWVKDLVAIALLVLFYKEKSTLGAFAFLALIYAGVSNGSLIRKVLSNLILKRFGVCCYSIYLFHILILKFLPPKLLIPPVLDFAPWWLLAATYVAFILSLCYFLGTSLFKLIEEPTIRFGKKIVKSRIRASATPALST